MKQWNIIIAVNILVLILMYTLSGPIPQPIEYHDFADQRTIWGIPYFGDVMTNIPFSLVGIWGLIIIFNRKHNIPYGFFGFLLVFLGLFLTGIGSSWYHLNPINETLVYDRACMAVALIGLLGAVIEDRTKITISIPIYICLLILSLGSVFYWIWTEHYTTGDLRPYAIVQYGGLLTVILILMLWKSAYTHAHWYWIAIACYVLAKITELTDKAIWDILGILSGHNIKHLLAALGGACLVIMLKNRKVRH